MLRNEPVELRENAGGSHRLEEQGFSLIEVLIASVLLLIISLGVIPLFVRSVGMNQEGRLSSLAAAEASSEMERLAAAPFDSPDLTIPNGATEIRFEQWQAEPRGQWYDQGNWTPGDGFSFHRTIRVRQFGLIALNDGKLEASELINGTIGAANPGLVRLKEIVVQVETGNFPGVSSRNVTLRSLRGI